MSGTRRAGTVSRAVRTGCGSFTAGEFTRVGQEDREAGNWKIIELAVFGSVLREDFRPDSDVDFLVRFAPDARWSLFDHARMERELEGLLGREVDLVSRSAVERSRNWIRREEILGTARTLYAA